VTIGKNGEKYVYSLNVEVEQIEVYKDIVITDDDGNEKIETVFDSYKQKLKFTDKNKDSSKEIAGLKDEKILVDNLLTEDYTTTRFDTEAEKFISEMITISDDENQTVNCDKLKKVMLAYQYLLYLSKGCDDLTQNYYKDYYKDPSDNSIWNTMGAGNKHKVNYIDYYHDYRYEVIKAAYEELQAKNELSYLARYFVVRSGNNILARMAPELEENILMEAAGAKLQKKMKKIKENHTYWFWRDHVGNYAKECQSAAERIINSARTNINDDLIIFKSLLSQLKSAESGKKTALKNYNNIYYGCDEKPSDTDSIRITKTDAQKKIETCLKNANSKLSDKEISKLTGLLSESETADYKTLADAIREICTKSSSEYVQAKEVLNDNIITQSEKFSASVLKYDSALISAQSLNEVQLADLRKLALKASDVTLSLAERKAASEEYDRIYKEYLESGLLQAETTLSELASNFVSDSFDSQKYYDWLKDNYYSYFDSDTLKIDLNKRMESYILNSSEGTDSYYEMFESFYSEYLKNIDSYRLNSYWLELENTRRTAEQENKDAVKLVKDVILAGVREWEKAERTLNTQRNSWAKNFIDKYEKETAVWQMNYNDFLEDKQEWINNLYIDALSETAVTENREQDISRHLVNTRKALREELSDDFAVDFDSASIVENLLGDTCLSKIEGLVAGGKNRIDENRITARTALSFDSNLSTLLKAQSVMNEVTEKMEKTAAARIAQEAVKNLEEMRRSYEGSISVENKQVRDSIRKQAINLGYEYSDTSIKRKVAVDATFWGPVYETQKVKIYEDFATAGPKLSVDLNSLTLMEGAVLTVAMKNARNELDMWYTKVFGTEDSPDDGKIYLGYNVDGLFGQHVGIGGKLKDNGIDPNKGLSRNIAKDGEGTGQMGRIMLDFAWNEVMLANGFAELGKPAWDQKLWSGDGFLGLEPPSLRVVSTIAAGIVASIVTWGAASGVAGVMTAAAVSASITMSNELMFAALDVTGGYKSPYEVGKSLAVSAATSVLGAAAGGAGAAAGSLNGIGGVALKTGITASNATMTQATNAFIMSGGDFESVRRSFNSFEDWSDIISQSAGAFVANSMTYATSGYQILDESTGERYWSKLSGFNSEQISSIQSLSSLTGGLTSSAVDLGLTGNTTFNVASIKGTGVLELTVGKDGLSSRLGSSGTDISFGKISSALLGVQTAVVNSKIIDYADKNKNLVGIDTALRVQYGFGDARAQEQFENILNGSTVVKAGKGDGRAVTVIEDGKRTVYLNNIGDNMTRQQQLDMGITLGHEAWRDGITDSNNMAETIYAVIGHSTIASNMGKDIAYEKSMENIFASDNQLATDATKYDAWTKAIAAGDNATADYAFANLAVNVLENYDSTGDYWKLVEHDNGTFGVKFDGNHSLVDEYGNVLVKNDMDIFDNDGNIIGHKTGMSFSASLGMLLGTYTNYLDSSADYKNGKNPTQEDIVRGIDDKGYIGKDDKSPTEMYLTKLGFSWNTKNATWENINNPNATIPINSYTMTLVDLIAGNGVDLKDGFASFKLRDEKNNIVGEASVPYGDGLDRYLAFENMIPQGDLLKAGIFKVDNSGNVQMYGVSSTLPTPTEFGEKHPAIADGTYAFKFDMHYPPNGSPYDALRLFNKDYQNIPINVNAVTGEKKHNPIYRSNVPGFYFDKIKAILKATTDSINYHRTNSGGFMDATRRTGSLGCITTFPSQYWRSLPNSKSNRAIDGYFYINRTLYNFY